VGLVVRSLLDVSGDGKDSEALAFLLDLETKLRTSTRRRSTPPAG
jgi:hypothetical protein